MDTLHKNVILTNIVALCSERIPKVSPSKMCVDLGISKSLITKLKADPDRSLNGDTAQKIANYFGVSVGRVLGTEEKPATGDGSGYSEEDLKLLEFFRTASERDKEILRAMMGGE